VRPRQILSQQFYLLTRRCTRREFLLRPDEQLNEIYLYCLAVAAQRYVIDVIITCAMSNHVHEVLFDRHGRIVEFYEYFHKLMAKAVNALRGRSENMWSNEPPSLVRLVDAADVLEKVVYVATNPVQAHLVERAHQWPGVNGYSDLVNRRTLTVKRPRCFFSADGAMPEEVTLEYTLPPELGDADHFVQAVRERVAAAETAAAEDRARTHVRVLGRKAVMLQSWRDSPATIAPRGNLHPRVAARNAWARVEALLRDRAFEAAYQDARRLWLAGIATIFPPGTYWLRRFAGVPVAAV
jgi:putative transposase